MIGTGLLTGQDRILANRASRRSGWHSRVCASCQVKQRVKDTLCSNPPANQNRQPAGGQDTARSRRPAARLRSIQDVCRYHGLDVDSIVRAGHDLASR